MFSYMVYSERWRWGHLTRVIKLDEDILRGFVCCAFFAVDDFIGDPLCLSDVVRHAPCGVDGEAEDSRARDAHQTA